MKIGTDQKNEYVDEDGLVHHVVEYRTARGNCPHCGYEHATINETTGRKVYDLDEENKKIVYEITQLRFRCKKCKKTWQADLPNVEGAYSGRLIDYVFSQVVDGLRSIKEQLSEELQIPFSSARKLLEVRMSERRQKHAYALPENLFLDQVKLKSHDVFLIIDASDLLLLDILSENELKERSDLGNVKEVWYKGGQEKPPKVFPNAQYRLYRPPVYSSGMRKLIAEGKKAGIDGELLRRYFETEDDVLVPELVSQSIMIAPISFAFRFLKKNKSNIEELRKYGGELPGFKAFAREVEEEECPEGFSVEGFERFCQAVENFEAYLAVQNGRKNGYDSVRELILFSENPSFPLKMKNDRNFGRPIPAEAGL